MKSPPKGGFISERLSVISAAGIYPERCQSVTRFRHQSEGEVGRQIFIPLDLAQVIVPDLTGHSLRDSEDILKKNKLKKGDISYIAVKDVLLDMVVSQSHPSGFRISENSTIDILVSRGPESLPMLCPT